MSDVLPTKDDGVRREGLDDGPRFVEAYHFVHQGKRVCRIPVSEFSMPYSQRHLLEFLEGVRIGPYRRLRHDDRGVG